MFQASLRLFLRYWLPLLIYAGIILFFSSQPQTGLPYFKIPDKILHIFEYTLLGFLLFRLFSRDLKWKGWRLWCGHIISAALFAFCDELLQSFIPTRDANPWDWIADMSGVLLGTLVYLGSRWFWEKWHT